MLISANEHRKRERIARGGISLGGRVTPIAPGPNPNDPPLMSPAGSVIHCTLHDMATLMAVHLGGGEPFLKPQTLERIHQFIPWGQGARISGANPMNYSSVLVSPDQKFALIMAANIGPDRAMRPCEEVGRSWWHST